MKRRLLPFIQLEQNEVMIKADENKRQLASSSQPTSLHDKIDRVVSTSNLTLLCERSADSRLFASSYRDILRSLSILPPCTNKKNIIYGYAYSKRYRI
jgi:hypothetical protein